jgi:hypothetical protein
MALVIDDNQESAGAVEIAFKRVSRLGRGSVKRQTPHDYDQQSSAWRVIRRTSASVAGRGSALTHSPPIGQ